MSNKNGNRKKDTVEKLLLTIAVINLLKEIISLIKTMVT